MLSATKAWEEATKYLVDEETSAPSKYQVGSGEEIAPEEVCNINGS
jgi:hypothetical protein